MNAQATKVAGGETSWLYTSWAKGITKFVLPLLGKGDAPQSYDVRLHFAELEKTTKAGERVFDVRVQGKVVINGLDIVKVTGGALKALTREISKVNVKDNLIIELIPRSGKAPVLNAIEVVQK